MSYSPEMITELQAIEDLDWAKATAFATKHMIKPRSVVSKAAALGIPYTKAAATGSSAPRAPKVSKSSLVTAVEGALSIKAPSLDKVSLGDLTLLLGAIRGL